MNRMNSSTIQSPLRRSLLLALACAPWTGTFAAAPTPRNATAAQARLVALETLSGDRLGVAAINTADGVQLFHRGHQRMPLCSTFKVLAAAAILAKSADGPASDLLQHRIKYARDELVAYSPVTEMHVEAGMTIAELCAAALRYSDNTAANLLLKTLGGPAAVTAYARTIGDADFRLDRWETALNSAIPGDVRDTSTPAAMAQTLQRLLLGDALAAAGREQLSSWMRGNTTSAARMRAGVPADWLVADKTGGGSYGTNNDVGVLWPPGKAPIVLAIYFTQGRKEAPPRDEVVAAATRIVVEAFR